MLFFILNFILQTEVRNVGYKFFDGALKKLAPDDDTPPDYAKFRSIILESIVLVNITAYDTDNPYLIFESLNNKGEELTQADLVRNYVFMKLPSEEQENIYTEDWLPLQESFKRIMGNKAYADELTNAFWFYLRKDGLAVNQKEVYKNIKKHIDSSKQGVKYELQKLIQFAKYYQRLNFETEEPEPKLKRSFERLRRLDFRTCHVFLLNIYHDYEEKRITLEKFVEILRYLESYFVRRLFAGISPKILGTLFNNLYGEVQKEHPDDLVDGLRKVLKSYDKTKEWPDDETFRLGIINDTIYSKSLSDRTKLILEILEASLTKEKVEFNKLSVEHVMPQTLNKEWKVMLGTNHASIHKRWQHTLGNLTLTGYNSELSNRPFEEKLKHLRGSNITLNKYFLKIDVWNEEAILTRAIDLADIAIKIWPR